MIFAWIWLFIETDLNPAVQNKTDPDPKHCFFWMFICFKIKHVRWTQQT